MGAALKHVLPGLHSASEDLPDAWDALQVGGAIPGGAGRLLSLRCIVWPGMPHAVKQHCAKHAPAVAVNPSDADVVRLGLMPAARAAGRVDDPLLEVLASPGRESLHHDGAAAQGTSASAPVVHIAERFRLAWASREERVRRKQARNRRQQQQRALRRSPAQAAVWKWEDDL